MERLEEIKEALNNKHKLGAGQVTKSLEDCVVMIDQLEDLRLPGDARSIIRKTVYNLYNDLVRGD